MTKRFFFVLALSIVWCIFFFNFSISGLACCLPLLLILYQFCPYAQENKMLTILMWVIYVVCCILSAILGFSAFTNSSLMPACATIFFQLLLYAKTYDNDMVDREFVSILYILGIFLLPLIFQFMYFTDGEQVLGILWIIFKWIFALSAIGIAISPFILLRSVFSGESMFDKGLDVTETNSSKIESVCKRVARDMGISFGSVRKSGSNYAVRISIGSGNASVNDSYAQDFMSRLASNGIDTSRIDLYYN
ncbi:MAG: hypothetical protein E7369_02035 [Clostridiales bacterium]|nr:hypothetical protein [Clostridiales bacterium]